MDENDRRLLNLVQSELPLTPTPYADLGSRLGMSEDEVLDRVRSLRADNIIRQVNAIFDTRALGYQSSLVASKIPMERLVEAAKIINAHPGVSHNYERNDDFNLWWTVAVPPGSSLERTVDRLHELSGAESTRLLPTLQLFKIGVNLDMTGVRAPDATSEPEYGEEKRVRSRDYAVTDYDKHLVRVLQEDLPLVSRPFDGPAATLGLSTEALLDEALRLQEHGFLRRFAAILYHRRAGFRANAMGVWAVPKDDVAAVGPRMASFSNVSHCYERPIYADWPFSIFTMVHGRSTEECQQILNAISGATGVSHYRALYSSREWKKTRVRYFTPEIEEWEREHLGASAAI